MSSQPDHSGVSVPDIDVEDVITIDDRYFDPENVCIVTGAASGIGRATTVALAANGLTVAATDIDADGLAETKSIADENGVGDEIRTITADLTEESDIEEIVETSARFGTIRFLANIAGVQHVDPIEEFPMDSYDTLHEVLARAPLYLSKLCIPHFEATESGEGCVGSVSSLHGHYVTKNKVAYNMFKFAIRGLTQSITAEGDGTYWSFSISPSPVKTPLVVNQIPDIAEKRGIRTEEVVRDVMMKPCRTDELIDPIDIGNMFVLGFSRKGKHFAGNDLLMDGGATTTY